MTARIRLTGRSSSHFTRVAMIFAHELGVPFELHVVHDLWSRDPSTYGGHPALKIPTLSVDGAPLFGTENICRRLVELSGRRGDARIVLTEHLGSDLARSAQELVWHAMSAQVQLVIGVSLAKLPSENPFFAKGTAGLRGALEWLEDHVSGVLAELPLERDLSLFEASLFCLVEHLGFRPTVSLPPVPRLRRFAFSFGGRESAIRTPFHFDPPTPERP